MKMKTETKRVPNYGPGSISTVAKGRVAALATPTKKVTLLNALSPDAKQIKNRIDTQDRLKREVGGKR